MENKKIWGYEDKEILDHRELYVIGYDPYKQEGSIGSAYIKEKYEALQEELDKYIMYDPVVYQHNVEQTVLLFAWINNSIESKGTNVVDILKKIVAKQFLKLLNG